MKEMVWCNGKRVAKRYNGCQGGVVARDGCGGGYGSMGLSVDNGKDNKKERKWGMSMRMLTVVSSTSSGDKGGWKWESGEKENKRKRREEEGEGARFVSGMAKIWWRVVHEAPPHPKKKEKK